MGIIAPHQNNEVRLVLAGLKPLATIEKTKDPIGYALAIALSNTGALIKHCKPTKDSPCGECIIVKPGNSHLISEYFWLLENGIKEIGIKEYHRSLGRLFGYSSEDIETFIKSEIDCECSKCKGN